jgi:hypothetical protein
MVKEEFSCVEGFFSPLPTHLARPKRTFYLCPSKKWELAGEIITP